jgi:hypothetical protein
MVAIVRYAYDKRANPQVGVAFPYIKEAYEVKSTCLFICIALYLYSLFKALFLIC